MTQSGQGWDKGTVPGERLPRRELRESLPVKVTFAQMQRTWKGRARWLRGIDSEEGRVGAQRWSLTQLGGLASWKRGWLS